MDFTSDPVIVRPPRSQAAKPKGPSGIAPPVTTPGPTKPAAIPTWALVAGALGVGWLVLK